MQKRTLFAAMFEGTTVVVLGLEYEVCVYGFDLLSFVSTFVLTRALFANNEIYKPFLLNSRAQRVSGKNEQLTQMPWRCAPNNVGTNAVASA